MRLRVSGDQTGRTYDLGAVMDAAGGDTGVPNGRLLNEFAEAVCAADIDRTTRVRDEIVRAMGTAALADAAAVIAAFNAYPRIADATGIPLEAAKAAATESLRQELGLEALNLG